MYIFSYKKWFQKPLHVSSLLFTVPFLYFYKDKLYDFFYFLTNRKRIKTENILTKSDDYIENKKEQFPNPFKGILEMFKPVKIFKRKAGKYQVEKVKDVARSAAKQNCLVMYDVFKKAHRMMTW